MDGIDKVISLQNKIDSIKRDRNFTKEEKDAEIAKIRTEMEKAKAVEAKNKDEVSKLISDAEAYLKTHFDRDYYQPVKESCEQEKAAVQEKTPQKDCGTGKRASADHVKTYGSSGDKG